MNDSTEIEDRGDILPDVDPLEDSSSPPSEQPTETPPDGESSTPEPAGKPHGNIYVPKARFDEVNGQLREERQARMDMELRLRALEMPKVAPFNLKEVEKAYLAAVEEGDRDKAAALFEQIRDHDRRSLTEQMTAQMRQEMAATQARQALETAAEAIVEKYPFLDSTHPEANAAAIGEVVEWRDYYMVAKQLTPAQALKKAVERVAPAYVKAAGQSHGQQLAEQRTQAQRLANAKAAAAIPPNTAQAGMGERAVRVEKADVVKMSDAEFAAIPNEELKKLRGDVVA